jgi:alkylation response protein AidB-like acyl-CoA dehydrogenase
MDFTLSPDEQFVQHAARDFTDAMCPPSVPRAVAYGPPVLQRELWDALAAGGWLGAAIPAEFGGAGSGLVNLGLFFYEAGRALLPTTFRTTVFAAAAVLAVGNDEQRRRLLPNLAAGKAVVGMALDLPEATAIVFAGGVASGAQQVVANAAFADTLLLFARAEDGGTVALLLPPGARGITLKTERAIGGEPVAEVTLQEVDVDAECVLGAGATLSDRTEIWEGWLDTALALLCMEMAGGMGKVVEMTAAYMKKREQFGKPLGSFQAVQHHLANMTTHADGAYATALQALWATAYRCPAHVEASIAKAWGGSAYKAVTVLAHQLHGGIGYVRESDLHLWSERAVADALSLGARDHHLRRLSRALAAAPR